MGAGDVGPGGADVAVAEPPGHLRRRGVVPGGDPARQVVDARRGAGPDVDGPRRYGVLRHGREERPCDVADVDEVAQDGAVLVDRDRLASAREAREERDDPRVGVAQRLARTVDVLQPQHDRLDADGERPGPQDVLLRELRRAVHARRGRDHPRVAGGQRPKALGLPPPRLEHGVRALPGLDRLPVGADPGALAVDGAARGEDDAAREDLVPHQRVEHRRRADDVDVGVPGRLGERLRGPGLGGEVDDDVGPQPLEQPVPRGRVGDVGDLEPGPLVEGGRTLPPLVDLRVQDVDRDDVVPRVGQRPGQGAPDEPGPAGDHARPRRLHHGANLASGGDPNRIRPARLGS
ncbi:hypothetical protein GCM10009814_15000 [Lapillicoccus jejuensis]